MRNNKMKLLLPSTMARAGWDVVKARVDIEAIPFEFNMPTPTFHALLRDAHGVALGLTPFAEAELRAAPNLRVVARVGVGYDTVDVAALTRHNIPLMVTGTANSPSVAEQALFFMLALAKRGARLHAMVREGRWADRLKELPVDLFGKTVLVVGFGRIGKRISKACLALGMTVLVYDPYVAAKAVTAAGFVPVGELDAALTHADFVTIHCPKNSETMGMFNAARLARMKSSAYLVNISRGGVVDQDALVEALRERRIAGAGLDVFTPEPLSPGHPLTTLDNVVLTPHVGAGTLDAFRTKMRFALGNIQRVVQGDPPLERVPGA